MTMLKVDNISAGYGRVQALRGVSLEVKDKTIVTLIGSNGAGKTTLLKVISGLLKPTDGQVLFRGERSDGLTTERIISKGLTHCPEGRRIFADLTVRENLEMGAFLEKSRKTIDQRIEDLYELFPILGERSKQTAGTMSGGEQQQLAIARSLMMEPKIILFDEPSLGLAPIVVEQVKEAIVKLRNQGITILLVEQNANMSLRISDYGYVMETGRIALEGPAEELRHDEKVIKAYLGG